MLELFYTNSLDALAERLAADLAAPALPPLQTETIVVPSEGMAYWLRLRLASLTGCAAGISMVFPGNFCQRLTATPEAPAFRPEDLLWQIYAFLANPEFTARYPALSAYVQDRDPLKPLQLARRLCALFQNYLIYRHELVLKWESGATGPIAGRAALAHEDWQAAIWQGLRDVPRAADFQRVLENPHAFALPQRLSVFGVGTLPPLFLRLLRLLSDIIPVRLYLPAPTPHYWGDIRSGRELQRLRLRQRIPDLARQAAALLGAEEPPEAGGIESAPFDDLHYDCGNPLLADLGRQGREFFTLLAAAEETGQGWQELAWTESGARSVLAILQQDVRELHERGRPGAADDRIPFDPADRSLQLHCCHSPLREVEVLHDQLLDALAADPTLQPTDILVLMTAPQDYAPWVDAVFGASPQLRAHYRLADFSAVEGNPVAKGLLQILALPQGRQEAAEVLGLLDLEPVREAAGIRAAELPKLRELVRALNIRWGISGADCERTLGLRGGGSNTWLDGLDRLLMGYAAGELDEVVCGVAPRFPGNEFDLAGRFAAWAQRLFDWCAVLTARPRPLEEWRRLVSRLCRELLGEAGSEEDTGDWLRLPPLPGQTPVPLEAVRDYLRCELEAPGGRGAFIGGGISFCALRPLRTVPFRLIAVLGLDYTRFPRRDRREAFDLLRCRPVFGDRSLRDDDCQLFLETILSARERLLLSYSGRSDTGLSLRPPSVCVSLLMNVIDHSFVTEGGRVSECLTVTHPLQPFSPRYFSGDAPLFTYAACYQPADGISEAVPSFLDEPTAEDVPDQKTVREGTPAHAIDGGAPVVVSVADDEEEIAFEELLAFWRHPVRAFCEQTLQAYFPRPEEELPAEETIIPDGRERLRLRMRLLNWRLREEDAPRADLYACLAAGGELPPQTLGRAWYGCLQAEVADFVRQLGPQEELPPLPFHLALPGFRVCGRLRGLTAAGQQLYRPARITPADRIGAWLRHLVWNALPERPQGVSPRTVLIGLGTQETLQPVPDATNRLTQLCRWRREGLAYPLPFFLRSSYVYAADCRPLPPGSRRTPRPESAARQEWAGSDHSPLSSEAEDPYHALCYPARTDADGQEASPVATARFAELSRQFWLPFWAAVQEPESE